ncbi:fibronectin type III domain-containing protein [Viridibacillus arvi]|uniref:fibronectin type III domain-containing protein n=1 Tax=Viridibacillus arvi TaxID=263475 RepID=UPI0034CDDF73
MKKDKFYLKVILVILVAISTILYLNMFNSYLHSFIEEAVINILTPIVVFFLLMKLAGVAKFQDMEGKNFIQLFIQMLYEFRYGIAVLILFVLSFQSIGKEVSFAKFLEEYYTDKTSEQIVTIYNVHDNVLYDHKNKVYYFYNDEIEVKSNNTYKITYLDESKIVVDIQGPINGEKLDLEDTVQITNLEYKDGAATLSWKPFFHDGNEVKQYRVEAYLKQDDGTLLRSGSQIVVEDRETSVIIKKLAKNKDYQFVVEPFIKGVYNDEYKGTSEFISIN